jgi:hypothetical protein
MSCCRSATFGDADWTAAAAIAAVKAAADKASVLAFNLMLSKYSNDATPLQSISIDQGQGTARGYHAFCSKTAQGVETKP